MKNTLSFFSEDLPPRILVHTARGYSVEGSAGEILVYPDSILDLDCTFNRLLGNPVWTRGSEGKDYPIGEYNNNNNALFY